MAEITQDASKMGKKTAEIRVVFYENGIGLDASETGVTKSQLVRGALAMFGEVGRDGLADVGEKLANFESLIGLIKEIKDAEDKKCQNSED